jgi:SAM-dependent methyltransferase
LDWQSHQLSSTLAEIARILRPGGLFAAYDYDWPPTLNWELDRLAQEVGSRLVELVRERGLAQNLKMWSKDRHLDRMRESAHFRFTREVLLHQIEHLVRTRPIRTYSNRFL